MMKIFECKLTVMENLFFASKEVGKEYITLGLIGNTALPYALNFIPVSKKQSKLPRHEKDFEQLNEDGIFITPVSFVEISFENDYYNARPDRKGPIIWQQYKEDGSMKRQNKKGRRVNMPDEGWLRLIKQGSWGYFYIIFNNEEKIPAYINEEKTFYTRIGKFMSKCKIEPKEIAFEEKNEKVLISNILRLEDIPKECSVETSKPIPLRGGRDTYINGGYLEGDVMVLKSSLKNAGIPKNIAFYGGI